MKNFRVLNAGLVLMFAAAITTYSETLRAQDAPVIISPLTASASFGQAFSYTIATTGTQPITFSATGIPLGLQLVGNTIQGIPQQFGNFAITLNAFNAAGTDTAVLRLDVAQGAPGQPPIITSNFSLNATQGVPVNFPVTASGAQPIIFTITGLPAGLSFDGQTITGIPSVSGTFLPLITATNSSGTDTQTLTITIAPGNPTAGVLPQITSPVTATGLTGQPFSYVITTEGTIPIAISASGLPIGLSLAGNTISGIPLLPGTFFITLQASNAAGSQVRQITFNIIDSGIVAAAPVITNALAVTGTTGEPFSFTLTASGETPITFTAAPLPPGLSLIGATFSGTAVQAGTFPVTITATNLLGTDVETLVITLNPPGVIPPTDTAPTITSATSAVGFLNQPFVFNVTATGADPITFTATGLPQGLTMDFNGVISGTPLQSGTFAVPVTATNIFGTQTQTLFVQILTSQDGAPVLTIPLSVSATVGQNFQLALSAAGTAPITFSANNLPAGISLIGNTLSGVPLLSGNFISTITAANALGTNVQNLQFNISGPNPIETPLPVITSPVFATGTVGQIFNFPLTATGNGPITFTTTLLPPGLSLVGSSITGIPQFAGNAQVTVTATNPAGSTSQDILISVITPGRILPAGITPVFTLTGTSLGVVGESFTLPLTATGVGTVSFTTTPLPTGLFLSGDTITGSSLVAGTFAVSVTAANSFGSATQMLVLTFSEPGANSLLIDRVQIVVNRARIGRDLIRVEGTVNLPAGGAGGQGVIVDIGGVKRSYTLNVHGVAKVDGDVVKVRSRRNQTPYRLSMSLRGNFGAPLDAYLNGTTALPVGVVIGGTSVQSDVELSATTKGSTTRAKLSR